MVNSFLQDEFKINGARIEGSPWEIGRELLLRDK
jgi:hypothetical protein